jgi:archaemetzincin
MPSLLLVPIPPVEIEHISLLRPVLESTLNIEAAIDESIHLDIAAAFDAYRNQYNSSVLLTSLQEHFPNYNGKILGISKVDFFVPVLTYVFGEAQLNGTYAVVSTYRLSDTLYGLPENPQRFIERFTKEAVHELGHTFGLYHCLDYSCVMHSSTTVEDIDIKGDNFCPACGKIVKRHLHARL